MKWSFIFLLLTSFVSTFASGIFWTGFPIFLNDFGHGALDLSEIYAFATFGSLAFGLAGGIWSDLGSCKKISVLSQLISAGIVALIYLLWDVLGSQWIMYALPILYFNFSVAGISEMVWIMNFDQKQEIKNKIMDRAMITLFAKLIGFTAGPVLFSSLDSRALIVSFGLFLTVALIQLCIKDNEKTVGSAGVHVSFKAILGLLKSPAFVTASFFTGMLSVPMNPMFVTHLMKFGTSVDVSWFWGLAGVAGFINLFLQRTGWLKFRSRHVLFATAVLIACVLVAFSSHNRQVFLGFSSMYVFGSLVFSLQLYLLVGSKSVRSSLGSSFGLLNLLIDAGVFIGMLLGAMARGLPGNKFMFVLIGLIIIRSFAYFKIQKRSVSP